MYTESRLTFIVMLNVIMLNVVMLSVVMLSVVMLSVVAPLTAPYPSEQAGQIADIYTENNPL